MQSIEFQKIIFSNYLYVFEKGPFLNDVSNFLRFLNPPSPLLPILVNRVMK